MSTAEKLLEMYQMQETVNEQVTPNWRDQGNNFHRCIWVECAEMLDYLQYKWWKKTDLDMEQARMEMVDIWHFMLCCDLLNCDPLNIKEAILDSEGLEEAISDIKFGDYDLSVIRDAVDRLALSALQKDNSSMFGYFFELMGAFGLSFDELYCYYVGKNALNAFRVDNGYQDGTYTKQWGGSEDNEVLTSLIEKMNRGETNLSELSTREFIYKELDICYRFFVKG